jgi:hypothetical protein
MDRAPGDGPDGAQHLHLLVAQCVGFQGRRRLHGHQGHELHQVVLQHVAHGTGPVVIIGAAADAHLLGHGDLHVVDEVAVPQVLDEGVGEAEHQQVLHRLLAHVVVDAEDLLLLEVAVQELVQHPGRLDVGAEGLFHHDAVQTPGLVEAAGVQVLDHRAEIAGLDGQVEDHVGAHAHLGLGQGFLEAGVGVGLVQLAAQVVEAGQETGQHLGIRLELLFQEFHHVGAPARLVEGLAALGDEAQALGQAARLLQPV